MNTIEEKIYNIFSNEKVNKSEENQRIFAGCNVPSFIKDFLMRRFSNTDGSVDARKVLSFLQSHLPNKNDNIKFRIHSSGKELTLLTRFHVESNIAKDQLVFSIPDLDIKATETDIPRYIADNNPDIKGGEVWGVITLKYRPPYENEKGVIQLTDYKPFKPYKIDLNYYRSARSRFNTSEWIDTLIRAMEYDPDKFDSLEQKLCFLKRLLIFVEPRLNLVELAPKGTGKSYIFGNFSKYSWMCTGGTISRAKLFFDMQKRSRGAFAKFDFVALDEVQTIKLSDEEELRSAFKSYLEQGWTTVGDVKIESNAGLILLGNIDLTDDKLPKSSRYFEKIKSFKESALLDRFHGFIEGWTLPRITKDMVVNGWTINVEYLSEIFNTLRNQYEYEKIVRDLINEPDKADMRDTKAVIKIATGFLKLLFPHIDDCSQIDKTEFNIYCLQPALKMRSIIREQLHYIDEEYNLNMPKITVNNIPS